MTIMLEMLGVMKKPLGQGPVEVELEEGATVRDFMTGSLGYRPRQVERLSYFIDGERVAADAVLSDGCRLKALMVLGGG